MLFCVTYKHILLNLRILMLHSSRGDKMRLRIGELREDNDLKQTVVAKALHMERTTLSKYETGKIDIPASMLIRLAKYYNVSIDYLLGLSDEKRPLIDEKKRVSKLF